MEAPKTNPKQPPMNARITYESTLCSVGEIRSMFVQIPDGILKAIEKVVLDHGIYVSDLKEVTCDLTHEAVNRAIADACERMNMTVEPYMDDWAKYFTHKKWHVKKTGCHFRFVIHI
jgi:hypothetical protein